VKVNIDVDPALSGVPESDAPFPEAREQRRAREVLPVRDVRIGLERPEGRGRSAEDCHGVRAKIAASPWVERVYGSRPMPALPCPQCGKPTPRLDIISPTAHSDYYRCDACSLVWNVPKDGRDAPKIAPTPPRK
jgi:hypothetical protein